MSSFFVGARRNSWYSRTVERYRASVRQAVYGTKNRWSLAGDNSSAPVSHDCAIELEIQGTKKQGYNLDMMPSGFFAADFWFRTFGGAIEEATELFGLRLDDWTAVAGGFNITRFVEELEAGDVDAFLTRLRSFFAAIPYELNDQRRLLGRVGARQLAGRIAANWWGRRGALSP